MDSFALKSLDNFQETSSALDLAGENSERSASNVLKTSFELFHSPSPSQLDGSASDSSQQYQNGIAEGERRAAELHRATITAMQTGLTNLQTGFSDSLEKIKGDNARLVAQIFTAILPALSKHSFEQHLKNIINAHCDTDITGNITISCRAEDEGPVSTLLANSPNPSIFNLKTAPHPEGQIDIRWENGGSEVDYSKAVEMATRAISTHFETQSSPT